MNDRPGRLGNHLAAEPYQITRRGDGSTDWWCHLCQTGDTANSGNQALDEHAIGTAAIAHVLGADHAAQKILHPDFTWKRP